MLNVTLRQLRIFESVARHLSFSRAAEEMHLTQPAVSMQVRALEDMVGLPLTEQVGKRIHLTGAGEEVARRARLMAQQMGELEETLAALAGGRGGRLAIGVVSTAKYFAPRLLAAFRREHPDVELRLEVHNREQVIELLTDNRIDLAIMGTPPQQFPTVAQAFADHPLVIIAGAPHALAGHARISPRALEAETWLIREAGSGTRGAMERYLSAHAIRPQKRIEMPSNETIKQAVMAEMGIAFLSAHTIGLEVETGRLAVLDVEGTPVMRQWFIVRREEKRLMPATRDFVDFLAREGLPPIVAARAVSKDKSAGAETQRRGERQGIA